MFAVPLSRHLANLSQICRPLQHGRRRGETFCRISGADTEHLLISGAVLAGAAILALIAHYLLFQAIERFARRKGQPGNLMFVNRCKTPARVVLPLLALVLALPFAPLPVHLKDILQHTLDMGVIASVGWVAIIVCAVAQRYGVCALHHGCFG